MKLSKAQERAKAKLTHLWKRESGLRESHRTLVILVDGKIAERRNLGFGEEIRLTPPERGTDD